MQLTHKQPDKRADLEVIDGIVAERAKVLDYLPPSEIAPNLHDPSSEAGDTATRENASKNARVGDDMEVSAIEALTNAKLDFNRAFDTENKASTSLAGGNST